MSDPKTIQRLSKISLKGIAIRCKKLGITDYGIEIVNCEYCGREVEIVKSRKKRTKHFFCSKLHYRKYMANRFDRWIASPQSVALPQNYDEFMAQNELPCPIDGCNWEGKFLSAHVNLEHGIEARTFKKMAGFNLSTGLVSPTISQKMRNSALKRGDNGLIAGHSINAKERTKYVSLEGKEHRKKALTLKLIKKHYQSLNGIKEQEICL